jgi:hypothetical protein
LRLLWRSQAEKHLVRAVSACGDGAPLGGAGARPVPRHSLASIVMFSRFHALSARELACQCLRIVDEHGKMLGTNPEPLVVVFERDQGNLLSRAITRDAARFTWLIGTHRKLSLPPHCRARRGRSWCRRRQGCESQCKCTWVTGRGNSQDAPKSRRGSAAVIGYVRQEPDSFAWVGRATSSTWTAVIEHLQRNPPRRYTMRTINRIVPSPIPAPPPGPQRVWP